LGVYEKEVPVKDAEIYLANVNQGIRKATLADGKTVYYIDGIPTRTEALNIADKFKNKGLTTAYASEKLPGNVASSSKTDLKTAPGVRFQVYIGEFIGEVPPEATEVYLNNYDKGVKRKKMPDGSIVYYVLDGDSYDEALKMKAHFISEGLSTVRIVAFSGDREISISEAFTAGLRFNVIAAEFKGDMPDEVKEVLADMPDVNVRTTTREDGFTVAYFECYGDIDAALKLKARLVAAGLSSVRVIAIKDGKEITLSEAMKIVYE
jgi:hypothetical protein